MVSLHYNGVNSYLVLDKTEICKFMAHGSIRWYEFCLGKLSKNFKKDEQGEICLNGTVYNFSVNLSSVEKEDIFNIYEYLKVKNNINNVWVY